MKFLIREEVEEGRVLLPEGEYLLKILAVCDGSGTSANGEDYTAYRLSLLVLKDYQNGGNVGKAFSVKIFSGNSTDKLIHDMYEECEGKVSGSREIDLSEVFEGRAFNFFVAQKETSAGKVFNKLAYVVRGKRTSPKLPVGFDWEQPEAKDEIPF